MNPLIGAFVLVAITFAPPTPSVEQMVISAAATYGLDGSFLTTLECESQLNPSAVGDKGTSFGVAQIHLPDHPEISKAQALDPAFAIDWAAQEFAEGHANLWSCYNELAVDN